MPYHRGEELAIGKYKSFIEDICTWNAICSNKDMTEQEAFDIQLRVTKEEVKETLLGIIDLNHREILDGIADTIVTAGFLAQKFCDDMNDLNELDIWSMHHVDSPEDLFEYLGEIYKRINKMIAYKASFEYAHLSNTYVLNMYAAAYKIYGEELDSYIDRVLKSNNTKYFCFSTHCTEEHIKSTLEKEISYCRNKYAGRHENIVAVKVNYEGFDYYVIRSNHGKGKILKPSTFLEPEVFL